MTRKLWVNQEHTQKRESEAGLFSQRTSSLDEYCIWHWRGDRWRESTVWLSLTMAFTCFSFSSFTKRRFCISTWMALTRRSCTKTSLTLSTPRGPSRRASNTWSWRPTHAFFLPLQLCVFHHSVHAPLHASPVGQLLPQPLLSALQLLLQWNLVILTQFVCFLQNANLKSPWQWEQERAITSTNHQSAKGVSDSVFYLFLMNLYFLLQVFNIALVVLNDCVLLCQFIALFVNSIFFGNEVTVHLLEHGHQCVSLKKVTDARRRQQLSKPTVRESWDVNRHLLYCTAEAPSVWSCVCPAELQSVWAAWCHHGGPSAHRRAEEGRRGPGGWLQSTSLQKLRIINFN